MPLEFRPKLDKIVELLLYLAHIRPGTDKYETVKFFYLSDREHLARYGRPITFESYFALWYGPVASKAMDLLEEDKWVLREAGIEHLPFERIIENYKDRHGNEKSKVCIGSPLRDFNRDLFSKSDLKTFDEIVDKYGKKSFKELMDLTHKHYAYRRAWGERGGSNRSEMYYEDMIEDPELRKSIIEEIGPIAANMQ